MKKGISPLISVVLIIAFTIALAVMVMNWGQKFSQNIQKQTEETSMSQITCATDVSFEIKDVCKSANNQIKIQIENNGKRKIDSFMIRSYQSSTLVEPDTANFGGNGIEPIDVELSDIINVNGPIKKVEAIPKITMEGKEITCATNIRSYGDLDSSAITKSCS